MILHRSFTGPRAHSGCIWISARCSKAAIFVLIISISLWTGKVFSQGVPSGVLEDVEGELEILHEDSDQGSRYHYFLKGEGGRFSLQFANDPPTHLTSGARVRVRGVRTNNLLALQSGGESVQTVAAAVPGTIGEQRTLVVLLNFRNDKSQPYTPDVANNLFFGTTSSFFWENSYQQTYLSGVIKGWYTIDMDSPVSAATCDTTLIASLAEQAAINAGVVLTNYNHKVYAFPQSGCGWWGLSSVGGSPSQSWVNGSLDLGVTAHELGHGLGLWHSHLLDCGSSAVIGANCTTNEYGDIVDMMGASHAAHYNSFQKERLGWLNAGASPPILTIGSDGTYTLEPYETLTLGPKALKILRSIDPSSGAKSWYYVESRKALGFDGFIANEPSQNILNGVLVHRGIDGNGDSSHLLDMTPTTPVYYWWYDPALVAGQNFVDATAGVTITANSVSSSGASVTVRYAMGVAVSTDQPSYNRTQTVAITVNVQSAGSPVVKASVTFTITKSNGSVVTANATTGTNGAAVFKLRLTKQDPVGTYNVRAVATKSGLSGSGITTFVVQ
jgi:hypothetical protein